MLHILKFYLIIIVMDQLPIQVVFPTVCLVQHRFRNIGEFGQQETENNIQILLFRSGMEYIGRYLSTFFLTRLAPHIREKHESENRSFTKNIPKAMFIMESICVRW